VDGEEGGGDEFGGGPFAAGAVREVAFHVAVYFRSLVRWVRCMGGGSWLTVADFEADVGPVDGVNWRRWE
jgi:hypothetical protein